MGGGNGKEGDRVLGLLELCAIGIGGMIGGGIFSVLGVAVDIAGHAAPLAFLLGGVVAAFAGYSYVKLALAYRDDGASFTYLERAFPGHPNVGGLAGWTVVVGYVGTLSLYAFTFGAYGAEMMGQGGSPAVRRILSAGILVLFTGINLAGAKASGTAEDAAVGIKLLLLALLGAAGLAAVDTGRMTPLLEHGTSPVFMAGAMVFVAYEGFQLITNAVMEAKDPERNVRRGVFLSIGATTLVYLVIAVVAVGNLSPERLRAAKEYALAVAAEPVLGNAGEILVGIAALLATSSAINGTSFGASRMMASMAKEKMMPEAFSFRRCEAAPRTAVITLGAAALAFTLLGRLETIAAFSSMTFLVVSLGVCIAAVRLRKEAGTNLLLAGAGIALLGATLVLLVVYLARTRPDRLAVIGLLYLGVFAAEFLFSERGWIRREGRRLT